MKESMGASLFEHILRRRVARGDPNAAWNDCIGFIPNSNAAVVAVEMEAPRAHVISLNRFRTVGGNCGDLQRRSLVQGAKERLDARNLP